MKRVAFALGVVIVVLLSSGCPGGGRTDPTSRIFYFDPPEDFNRPDIYFRGHHYVARVTEEGIDETGMVHFDEPYVNFGQSAWDPESRTLYTWKKNYRGGKDYLLRVSVPGIEVEPVARFPETGRLPLLAMDTKRDRILLATREGPLIHGFRGGRMRRDIDIYDLDSERWSKGSFSKGGLITISYSPSLDRYVGLGRNASFEERDDNLYLYHLDPEGNLIETVTTDLESVLVSPIPKRGPDNSLVNQPEVQSRILGDELFLIRYVDLGRPSSEANFQWKYEIYAIDPKTGQSRFVRSFE